MRQLFKQVNKASNLLWLGMLMMTASCTACNENSDVLEGGTRPDQFMLSVYPPNYHEPTQKRVSTSSGKREPIIINGQGSSPMSLLNRTGKNVAMQDITVEVSAKATGSIASADALLSLTLGNVTQVIKRTKHSLPSICGQAVLQPNAPIQFIIKDIKVDPARAPLPLHFYLIIQGDRIQTIEQEVIWNP